jgi:heme-degrading monooxygenase HmoA
LIASLVRFTSNLADDDVQSRFEERADRYRDVAGLVEKIYVHYRETGDHGAVYVWESEEDFRRFRSSDLARTIPDAYAVQGAPQVEVADVSLVVKGRRAHATTRSLT